MKKLFAIILTAALLFGFCIRAGAEDETVTVIDRRVNFVGMSIWWNDGRTLSNGETARGYQTLLKERFRFSDTKDYCYNGSSLASASEGDIYGIMESRSSSWKATEGDIWTLDTMTNDFKRDIPIGTVEDYTNATGAMTYYGALRAFKDRVETLSGTDAVVICSNALRRRNSGYTSVSSNKQGHTLADYEAALLDVAERNGWYFVDQFRDSGVTDENLSETTLDGLHLNNLGYSLAVEPWIEQFLIAAQSPEKDVFILGDTDGDGEVTIIDVTVIQRYLAKYEVKDPDRLLRCGDVNGGGVTIIDVTHIQRYLAFYTVPYAIGQPISDDNPSV